MGDALESAAPAEAAMLAAYRAVKRRRDLVLVGFALACLAALVFDATSGDSGLGVMAMVRGVVWPETLTKAQHVVVWDLRLPVAIMALLVGAALSLAGAELQTALDNPLASEMTLGLSSAASFGAALAIVLGLSLPGLPDQLPITVNAFVFTLGSVLLLQALGRRSGGGAETLVLFGIGLLFAFNAAVSFLQFVATADALQQFIFWGMGSLSRTTWGAVFALAGVIALVLPFSMAACWRLTAMRFGDERAMSFGVNVKRERLFALVRISLLSATAVAFCGTIGFVGLVGPHIARMLVGEDHRHFLPASALIGALVMSLASVASKTVLPGVIVPIGIVTAFIGLPVFFLLVMRRGLKR